MKKAVKLCLTVCIAALCLIFYRKMVRAKEALASYLKHETNAGLIQNDRFLKKVEAPLPVWMQEQLEEDFNPFLKAGISKKQVDATFAAIRKNLPDPLYIRYRIINNTLYRYFPEGELISLEDNGVERTFKTLLHFFRLQDCDFIVSYQDGVPAPGQPAEFYHTDDKSFQAPLLVFARIDGAPHTILIPDYRSISEWWAKDVKTVRSHISSKPWHQKKEMAFWRGGLTRNIRYIATQIGLKHSALFDIKFVGKELGEELKEVVAGFATLDEFMDYKYLPTFDGVICAYPAFQWRLLSNSVTLKQESNEIQWFFRAVKPYEHYIPIKNDLSDFHDQILWAKAHDEECRHISERAMEFAQNNLMMEDHYLYLYHVLKKYASLQRSEFEDETKADHRWVNIQKRRAFKRKVQKEGRIGEYNAWLSPFATTSACVGSRGRLGRPA